MSVEQCCEHECIAKIVRGDAARCGGVLFGTRDDPGLGCGSFFCDQHLVGHRGPFYCQACWDGIKRRASGEAAGVRAEHSQRH